MSVLADITAPIVILVTIMESQPVFVNKVDVCDSFAVIFVETVPSG